MKSFNQLLKSKLPLLVPASLMLLLTFTVMSCNNSTEDTKEIAEDQNEEKFDDVKFEDEKVDDAEFLVNAAEIHLEEIQLGKLAQSNSVNDEVKKIGKMMETDHSKALADLKGLAATKQMTIPTTLTENGQEAYKKLVDKKGKDFDEDFTDMLIDGHEKAINKFEKASTDANDADIRNWALSMIPTLREHLKNLKVFEDKANM